MNKNSLFNSIISDHPQYSFKPGSVFHWNPTLNLISYQQDKIDKDSGVWSLLHELGHATLDHSRYYDDFQLLIMESSAWKQAQKLSKMYDVLIKQSYIDQCLDGYREWLHQRSKCNECGTNSLQCSPSKYHCHSCLNVWSVTPLNECKQG